MTDNIAWTAEQRERSDEVARALGERLRHTGPKLTLILGKNIGKLSLGGELGQPIFWPELKSPAPGVTVPQHPDAFIGDTVDWIIQLLCHGKGVQLWTYSEYLVSWVAQAVGDNKILYQCVEVRLYEDDNTKYRAFGISRDGTLCNIGYGDWPFGWFMPSC